MTLEEMEKLSAAIDNFDAEAATEEYRRSGEWPRCLACNGGYVVDIEDEATALCHGCAHGLSADLAVMLLHVLPVVRAAEEWEQSLAEPNGGRRRIKEHETLWALADYPQCRPIWAWCLARNLYSAACACKAWRLGKACQLAIAVRPRNEWYPGCGRSAP